jgi:HK97 gp10 family phage protein
MNGDIRGLDELMVKIGTLTGAQLRELAEKTLKSVALAQVHAAKLLVPVGQSGGGELRNSIHVSTEKSSDGVVGLCYSDSDHAAFVEFGTGPVGAASGGNGSDVAVTYSMGPWKHKSRTGKVFYTDYWIYRDENGRFHATRGQPAQPFMYPSAMAVKRQAADIQMAVLKRYIKRLGV